VDLEHDRCPIASHRPHMFTPAQHLVLKTGLASAHSSASRALGQIDRLCGGLDSSGRSPHVRPPNAVRAKASFCAASLGATTQVNPYYPARLTSVRDTWFANILADHRVTSTETGYAQLASFAGASCCLDQVGGGQC
jgi:hypothetical protein